MTRKLDLLLAGALLAAGAALALSGRIPRLAGAPPAADRSSPAAAAPSAVASAALEALFGGAPAPAFRSMRRVEFLEVAGSRMQTGEHRYRVVEANGWRTVVQDSATQGMPGPPGMGVMANVTDQTMEGPLDLFHHAWRYSLSAGPGRASADSRVVAISGVQGRLFPLAVGNRLRFQALEGGAVEAGRMKGAPTESYVYEFRVTGVEGGWAESTPAVPGPVYVIEVQVKDPVYGEDRAAEVHYAPALGAAVRVRTLGDAPPTDERLVSWQPAR